MEQKMIIFYCIIKKFFQKYESLKSSNTTHTFIHEAEI